jgi:hypothetical protein
MSVLNRRNAIVGFIALKIARRALERRFRGTRGGGLKVALLTVVGIVSFGVLAGLAAVFLRGRRQEPQRLEGYAVADEAEEQATVEQGSADAEPIAAT